MGCKEHSRQQHLRCRVMREPATCISLRSQMLMLAWAPAHHPRLWIRG